MRYRYAASETELRCHFSDEGPGIFVTFDTFFWVLQGIVWTLTCSRNRCRMSKSLLEKGQHPKQKTWRRRYSRHRADFLLKATSLNEGGYNEIRGRCADIGRGGMGTVLTAEVQAGEVVSLDFALPNSNEPFAVRAIVRYRRGFVHGLEFLGLSSTQEATISAFCTNLEEVD